MTMIGQRQTVEVLRFGYGETKVGLVLVAVSSSGVAAILLGSDRGKLRRELGGSFQDASFVEDQAGLVEAIGKVVALVDDPGRGADFALDMRGSELEMAVWQALRTIPVGETRSYGALAKTLPMPAMAQEVGAACAANRIAVAIPCHRVVKADGSISGYRWGVDRKRRLLSMEALG